jgi:hypothetical protein
MIKIICLFSLIIFLSCHSKEKIPQEVLSPAKMKMVYWDYLKADAQTIEEARKDNTKEDTMLNLQYQAAIFNHHQITKETFYKSYQYYMDHPSLMLKLMDSIVTKQTEKNEKPMILFDAK